MYKFNLEDYEEECIEYKYNQTVSYVKTCLHHSFYGLERHECAFTDYLEDDWRKPKLERIVERFITNECIKYRLVRYTK